MTRHFLIVGTDTDILDKGTGTAFHLTRVKYKRRKN